MAAVSVEQLTRQALAEARHLRLTGRYEQAVACYRRSLGLQRTVEGHLSLAWLLSLQADYEGAIRECQAALELDPEAGQPCCDIGAYLLEIGRPDEAVPWLRRAIWSRRCPCRHYAHVNLAGILERQGQWGEALEHYRAALLDKPDHDKARLGCWRLMASLN